MAVQRRVTTNAPTTKRRKANPANKTSAADKQKNNKARAQREAKKSAADKKKDAARAKVTRDRREKKGGAKTKLTPKQRLAARLDTWGKRKSDVQLRAKVTDDRLAKKEKAHATWLEKKQKVESKNLERRYSVARANVKARMNARLKTMNKRKPKLVGGKITVPKVETIQPKLKVAKALKAPAKPAILRAKKRPAGKGGSSAAPKKPAAKKPAAKKPAAKKPAGKKPTGSRTPRRTAKK